MVDYKDFIGDWVDYLGGISSNVKQKNLFQFRNVFGDQYESTIIVDGAFVECALEVEAVNFGGNGDSVAKVTFKSDKGQPKTFEADTILRKVYQQSKDFDFEPCLKAFYNSVC